MAKAGYYALTPSAAVALVGGTAKTVLFVIAPSGHGLDLKKIQVSFDGVTIGNTPVYVEVTYCTGASNVTPGTGNTAITVNQEYGRVIAATGMNAGAACTAEPTVQTTIRGWDETPYGGLVMYDWPLGDTPDCAPSQGFAIRCTAQQGVNARAELHFERC